MIMRGEPFQVALLDMMMPEVDGIDLARQIKADPALAKTAVIFASSVGSRSEFSARLVGLEVDAWLMKPVPESLLYDALVKVLAAAPAVTVAKGGCGSQRTTPLQASSSCPGDASSKCCSLKTIPINQKVARLQLAQAWR